MARAWVRLHDPGRGEWFVTEDDATLRSKDSSEPGELLRPPPQRASLCPGAGLPGVRPLHSSLLTADRPTVNRPLSALPTHTWSKPAWLLLTPRITPTLLPTASEARRPRAPLSSPGWRPPSCPRSPVALPTGPASTQLPSLFPLPGMLSSPFSHFSAQPAPTQRGLPSLPE